ncbi:PREDICTED: ATP-dependent DNA helicase PIF1 [Nicrophorus vespilloides]|uniref:ATP-dependent DNA helicase PIF1 n=1 Tax=Nicrophorus vespilloides TaxID=110193 RepID=A0ABM1N441_NICVS|nr:PREDICTED: ATP-dependent DNA helicase PIF1 [Nicrophorus vespilloides]
MDNESVLACPVNVEWCDPHGVVIRKMAHKKAQLKLIRNELRKIYIEIGAEKMAPVKLELKGIAVHKKFMAEGKASIKFQESRCTIYISNAPPSQLTNFLRTMFIKMTGQNVGTAANNKTNPSLRTQLLSNKPKQYQEISPVTTADVDKLKKPRATDTTPSPLSRKRKLTEGGDGPAAKKPPTPLFDQPLTIEQRDVLDACLSGQNLFFTGSAGTGKSYLLRKIIGALPPDVTVATASTGVAACHIGGTTLHQFAGIGSSDGSLERAKEVANRPPTSSNWRRCKHLIIDEISMIDGDYFEKIEAVARHVRKNDKPFGGIQLILCGDFLQLPPVVKTKENKKRFCFQTKAWKECVNQTFELKQVHRQSDCKFIDILNKLRIGEVSDEVVETLARTSKQRIEKDGILATRLCSHMADANMINESKIKNLPGEAKLYDAQDSDNYLTKQLDQQTPVPGKLQLKVDAQVMLLKNVNVSAGLVNGARGVVTGFRDGLPVVRFRNNREYVAKHERWMIKMAGGAIVSRRQIPLKLAWAFSIHKSQGLTLDCVEMSLAKVFEAGQAYVALSRAQSLETLRVLDFKASQVWANPDVLAFHKQMRVTMSSQMLIPLGAGRKATGERKKTVNKKLFSNKPLVSIT